MSNIKRQLFLDVEDKTEEARSKFSEISECTYSSKYIGSSGQNEYMTCDCYEDWDANVQKNLACGEESDCINRVTSVECVNKHCHCGKDCQNQRFQKKSYANISVFQTELKGYGVRANENISESSFIYEYIGEVIDETTFRKRMIYYDEKNFKHFYFMMLKNDSFIDATLKGSLARFCNHSCNPNAYVDKWVVGDKLRMGIFAKRHIQKGEEITFDYNVDRYGAQSQECYCGEPNCIKVMGGKTQTDAVLLLPEGISDVLGVTAKQERQWLKENKHLKAKEDESVLIDEFIKSIVVEPLLDSDVSRVMGELMKSQEYNVIGKLIERIYITNDESVNSLIVRFHGYKTLSKLISNYKDKIEFSKMILTILKKWPKMTRNKISSSQIEDVVRELNQNTEDEEVKELSSSLLDEWSNLQMAYRIPKNERKNSSPALYGRRSSESSNSETPQTEDSPLPDGWEKGFDPNTQTAYYFHRKLNLSRWDKPIAAVPKGPKGPIVPTGPLNIPKGPKSESRRSPAKSYHEEELARREEEKLKKQKQLQFNEMQEKEKLLQELILQSQKEAEEKKLLEEKLKSEKREKEKEKERQKKKNKKKSSSSESFEQQWTRLFASHVPNLIKKHEKEIGRDNIKGCARDLVKILVEKELKKESKPPGDLDHHKLKKIKEFSKIFMDKFLVKYKAKHQKRGNRDQIEKDAKRPKTE